MSSEELKLMPMPSLGEFIDWVWQLKEDRDALRAELAEVKGREAVALVRTVPGTDWKVLDFVDGFSLQGQAELTRFYASPPASPYVDGLVKALEDCAGRLRLLIDSRRHKMLDVVAEEKARTALSTWRQAHTPSTLPASSAEE